MLDTVNVAQTTHSSLTAIFVLGVAAVAMTIWAAILYRRNRRRPQ